MHTSAMLNFAHIHYIRSKISLAKLGLSSRVAMDARFMQMHNLVLTREVIINSMFPVDRMRELNFHRETAVSDSSFPVQGLVIRSSMPLIGRAQYNKVIKGNFYHVI